MASLAPLLRVQALGAFGVGRLMNDHDPKARRRLALAAVGVALLAVYVVAYMWAVGQAFVALGAAGALPGLAVAAVGVGCVFSTFAKANGLLFRFRDFDLVVSMPAPLWAVVVSRVAPLYGMGLVCSLVLGAPLMAAYLPVVGVTPAGVITALLVLLLAPALPVALALAASFCVAWAASRTPRPCARHRRRARDGRHRGGGHARHGRRGRVRPGRPRCPCPHGRAAEGSRVGAVAARRMGGGRDGGERARARAVRGRLNGVRRCRSRGAFALPGTHELLALCRGPA